MMAAIEQMGIKVRFDSSLKHATAGKDNIEVNGRVVGECIDDLANRFPAMKKWLFGKHGILLVLIFLNGEIVHQKNLDRPVEEGDELLLSLISGGG